MTGPRPGLVPGTPTHPRDVSDCRGARVRGSGVHTIVEAVAQPVVGRRHEPVSGDGVCLRRPRPQVGEGGLGVRGRGRGAPHEGRADQDVVAVAVLAPLRWSRTGHPPSDPSHPTVSPWRTVSFVQSPPVSVIIPGTSVQRGKTGTPLPSGTLGKGPLEGKTPPSIYSVSATPI